MNFEIIISPIIVALSMIRMPLELEEVEGTFNEKF